MAWIILPATLLSSIIVSPTATIFVTVHVFTTDAIQGWNYNNRPGIINSNVVIDGNTVISKTVSDLPYPAYDLHGITIFDGNWDQVKVINNVVITDTWHGISLIGMKNSFIINNTVWGTNPSRDTWIVVQDKKGQVSSSPSNIVIRNNIARSFANDLIKNPLPGVTMDHNVVAKYPGDLFIAFNNESLQYDLHLAKRSPARGAGTPEFAPVLDIEGHDRSPPIDAGAYSAASK